MISAATHSVLPSQPKDPSELAQQDHLQAQHLYRTLLQANAGAAGTSARNDGGAEALTRNACSAVRCDVQLRDAATRPKVQVQVRPAGGGRGGAGSAGRRRLQRNRDQGLCVCKP
jgi:hypothetical protein